MRVRNRKGAFDLAFLRSVPNLIIAAPMNEIALRNMMFTAYKERTLPFAIRYPRGRGVLPKESRPEMEQIPIGKGRILKEGGDIAFISIGHIGNAVAQAAAVLKEQHGIDSAHIDIQFLKPLDETLILETASRYKTLVTVEDGTELGGLYSAVAELLESKQLNNRLLHIAIPDEFVPHGAPDILYKELGMDADGIVQTVLKME